MIWATVSSRSCFCWLYRASPSLAAKNIINLISVLTIWWCPCVEYSLVLLEEGVCYDQCIFLVELYTSLCPASFSIPRANLPVTPGVSWLPTFAFQSPIMKRPSSGVLVLEGLVGLHRTVQHQLLHRYWLGHGLGLPWYWIVCLGNKWQIDGETVETVADFIYFGSKITADIGCSHEVKRHLLLGRNVMTNLDSILKSRDFLLPTKSI